MNLDWITELTIGRWEFWVLIIVFIPVVFIDNILHNKKTFLVSKKASKSSKKDIELAGLLVGSLNLMSFLYIVVGLNFDNLLATLVYYIIISITKGATTIWFLSKKKKETS